MASCKGNRITKFALSEFQGLVAFLADEHIHHQPVMLDNQQMLEMQKFFHGDANEKRLSHLELLVHGKDMFADLFEQDPEDKNSHRIKQIFLWDKSVELVQGKNVTRDIISRTGISKEGGQKTGRGLKTCVENRKKNLRKDLSVMHKHVDKNTGDPSTSGDTLSSVTKKNS